MTSAERRALIPMFDQDEITNRARKIAELLDRLDDERYAKRRDTAAHNATIKSLKEQIAILTVDIRRGTEPSRELELDLKTIQ